MSLLSTNCSMQGELALCAGWPSMFRAYWNEPERYRKCFADGWYLTGDLARRDRDGYFWFVGRKDDVIKTAGHLIGPFEVESILMEHPAVAEAGVIGKPDPVAMEVVKAFVALKDGFEPGDALKKELLGFARTRLGAMNSITTPKVMEVRDSASHRRRFRWWDWRFWLRWIVANTIGEVLGLGLAAAVAIGMILAIGEPKSLAVAVMMAGVLIVAGACEGVVVGLAQWRVLRHRLPRVPRRDWVRATAMGALVAWALGMAPSTLAVLNQDAGAPDGTERLAGLSAGGGDGRRARHRPRHSAMARDATTCATRALVGVGECGGVARGFSRHSFLILSFAPTSLRFIGEPRRRGRSFPNEPAKSECCRSR
jgi:AMP-binding enzyme/AMP-binding enzyme C-terminal domain